LCLLACLDVRIIMCYLFISHVVYLFFSVWVCVIVCCLFVLLDNSAGWFLTILGQFIFPCQILACVKVYPYVCMIFSLSFMYAFVFRIKSIWLLHNVKFIDFMITVFFSSCRAFSIYCNTHLLQVKVYTLFCCFQVLPICHFAHNLRSVKG